MLYLYVKINFCINRTSTSCQMFTLLYLYIHIRAVVLLVSIDFTDIFLIFRYAESLNIFPYPTQNCYTKQTLSNKIVLSFLYTIWFYWSNFMKNVTVIALEAFISLSKKMIVSKQKWNYFLIPLFLVIFIF